MLSLLAATLLTVTPLRVHPENPRVFVFRGKPTVLITSGEHYGAVLNQAFDQKAYLEELKHQGLNLTRLFSGTYCEGWGEPWNTLNPPPGQFLSPWARSSQPGYADGGNKFDLDQWDTVYWNRLKGFIRESGKRGIVVEYVLFCTFYGDGEWDLSPMNGHNNINGIGNGGRATAWSDAALLDAQERFVRKAAGELKEFDNVYLELANEPYWADGPALGHPWNDRMVRAIREVAPNLLVALNIANGSQKVARAPAGISILNFHYAHPPTAVELNGGLGLPIAFDESGFQGPDIAAYRKEAWEFMLSGGSVYSGLDWTFSVASPSGQDLTADPKLGPKSPALRPQLGILKRFLDRLPLVRMRPMPGRIGMELPGSLWTTYISDAKPISLDLPPGRYRAEWTSPVTGEIVGRTDVDAHYPGATQIAPPQGEVAVVVRAL